MYWDRGLHLCNVDIHVPSNYIFIGNTTPLTTESTNTYAMFWGNGYDIYRQLKWQEIPKEKRDLFKKADKSKKKFHLQEMSAVFLNTISMTSGRLLKMH